VSGIQIARRDPFVTAHSHYMYMVVIDENADISRDTFVDALTAEGVPAYRAYPAISDAQMFKDPASWDRQARGVPAIELLGDVLERHPHPHSRRMAQQGLWLHHQVLRGGSTVQDRVGDAFEKIVAYRQQFASQALVSPY